MYLIVWMELEAHCSLCVFTIEPHQKHNQWRLLGKFGILCCVQLLYEKPTSVNQAGLCQAKLEHNCWSLIFFFSSVLVQCFWHLASHSESRCIFFRHSAGWKMATWQMQGFYSPTVHTPLLCTCILTHFLKALPALVIFVLKLVSHAFKFLRHHLCFHSQMLAGHISVFILYLLLIFHHF